jgi:hypothetical protein
MGEPLDRFPPHHSNFVAFNLMRMTTQVNGTPWLATASAGATPSQKDGGRCGILMEILKALVEPDVDGSRPGRLSNEKSLALRHKSPPVGCPN